MLRPGCLALCLIACACAPPRFRVLAEADGWLLSVTATEERVLAVGGKPGQGGQPGEGLLLRLRAGAAPETLRSPIPGMLWWVHDAGGGVAWLAGEGGALLRFDEASGSLRAVATGTRAVLYGVIALPGGEVIAVGGDDQQGGVVLRGGEGGVSVDASAPRSGVLYKVFAPDPAHLFVVGGGGALLRYVVEGGAGRWLQDRSPLPPTERLLTVHGRSAQEVYAVGGLGSARLLRWDGAAWSLVETPGLGGLNGVFAEPGGLLLGGARGLLAAGSAAGPFTPAEADSSEDVHAVFSRGDERLAAGGNLSQFGVSAARGVLLQQGGPRR